jgi:hypothetical protein
MECKLLHEMTIEEIFMDERNKIIRCLADILENVNEHIQIRKQMHNILNDSFNSPVDTINYMIVDYTVDLSNVKHSEFLKLVHRIIQIASNNMFESVLPPMKNDETCAFNLSMYHILNNTDWNTYWRPDNPLFSSRPQYVEILLHYYNSHAENWCNIYWYHISPNLKDRIQLSSNIRLLEQLKYISPSLNIKTSMKY